MKKIETYFSEAHGRAKRRKSPWNILLAAVTVIIIALVWFYSCKLILFLTHRGVPFQIIANGHDVQMIFVTIPLFFPSLIWGMILGNSLIWLIPPARRTFEEETKGDKSCSFKNTMSGLLKLAVILSVITIPIAIIASYRIKL